MKIDDTEFGSITTDGKTYEHDVVIRLSDKVVKRKKKLSKRLYGTSHTISEDEARFVFEKGCKELILGTGQYGNAALSPEAAAFLKKKGCNAETPTFRAHVSNRISIQPRASSFAARRRMCPRPKESLRRLSSDPRSGNGHPRLKNAGLRCGYRCC
jgi:hypothetical protein